MESYCRLLRFGYTPCGINVLSSDGKKLGAPCMHVVKYKDGKWWRLVYDYLLSRPEDYLSIYQSGCNHDCLMCHSWYFSRYVRGTWLSSDDFLEIAKYYYDMVTVWEPRSRSTMWHASDLCAHCGLCIEYGVRGKYCPGKLKEAQIVFSPQGYGPARNIISFTGGDVYCCYELYCDIFSKIKKEYGDELWIHIETNGYGLVRPILERLYSSGLDSIWLDMKAFHDDVYRKLCGTTNKWILEVPQVCKDLGIVLEVVLLYIPGIVELNEIMTFGKYLAEVDRRIPVMVLAFFPRYKLSDRREPTYDEMVSAYRILRNMGMENVKLGNVGVFCKTNDEVDKLIAEIGREAVSL